MVFHHLPIILYHQHGFSSSTYYLVPSTQMKDLKRQLHAERRRAEKLQTKLQEVLSEGQGKSMLSIQFWMRFISYKSPPPPPPPYLRVDLSHSMLWNKCLCKIWFCGSETSLFFKDNKLLRKIPSTWVVKVVSVTWRKYQFTMIIIWSYLCVIYFFDKRWNNPVRVHSYPVTLFFNRKMSVSAGKIFDNWGGQRVFFF